jgi:DNA repair protein RecN (Recombination protein N)
MIRLLTIRQLAIVDSLDIEFEPGLNVLTGETGAGKSIVVEAVALLLGGRASPEMIRTGAETALVQAELETPDGRSVLVRRELTAQGRSRAFVDDELVTSARLRATVGEVVELHGQQEHQKLLSPSAQLALLDDFGDWADLLAEVAAAFTTYETLRQQLADAERDERARADRLELLAFQLGEIDSVAPVAGEDETLAAERQVVAAAERVRRLAAEAYDLLYEGDHAVMGNLQAVWKRVEELAAIDARLQPQVELRDAVDASLGELAYALRRSLEGPDASESRIEEVEARLAQLERLKKRFGPRLADVIETANRHRQERDRLERASADARTLGERLDGARQAFLAAAQRLSDARRPAAVELARAVECELTELAMPGTRCEIRLSGHVDRPEAWSALGVDEAEIYISPNLGEDLRPLARIASGGELSRLMLAFLSVTAARARGRALLFDEVDAGIGGRTADAVGARLQRLSDRGQVMCVTHLPQVAAHGDAHFEVRKLEEGDRTVARVARLTSEARVEELARMMGGALGGPTVRAGARELLEAKAGRPRATERKAKAKAKVRVEGDALPGRER